MISQVNLRINYAFKLSSNFSSKRKQEECLLSNAFQGASITLTTKSYNGITRKKKYESVSLKHKPEKPQK